MRDSTNRVARNEDSPADDRQHDDRIIDDGQDGEMDPPPSAPPLKRHGDALLDGSGSRQGANPPVQERTADA
jgi:hypothetical protein